ncbi:MAG: hypothetical protein QOK35_2777 [Pseudonocardiales bacterium]|nr:hypothetical protein [Pseudonocardiales bacterium]
MDSPDIMAVVNGSGVTHYDVHGLVALRLVGAPAHVLARVSRELGAPRASQDREPDLTIRFVDDLPAHGYLRLLGLHDAAFDDEYFYLLDAQRQRARIDFARLGEPGEIVCERGIAEVPLLVPLLGLHLARTGHVLLHAASFVHRGHGVLVTGWQKGGKTETLLPFMAAGARYVADEWTVVGGGHDGGEPGMYGLSSIARVWDWHLREVPELWDRITPAQRARLRVWRAYRRLYRTLPRHDHLRSWPVRLLRQVSVDGGAAWQGVDAVPPARLFGDRVETGRAPLDRIFLPVLGRDGAVDVLPTDARTVAARMVSSLEFERARLSVAYQQFRFAFPERANPLLDTIRDRELALLTDALGDLPAYEIRHPYPVSLHDLYAAADPYC